MDLSNLPPDTCPLCRQAALNRIGRTWSCDACGCRLAFDPQTRRAQIVHFPEAFADLEGSLSGRWLTRREMFAQVAEAQQRAMTPPNAQFTLLAATTLTILTAFSMLATVAVAFVLSPSLARTRQTIAAAYQPTPSSAFVAASLPTPTPTPSTSAFAASPEPTIVNDSAKEVSTPAGDEQSIATPEAPATDLLPVAPPAPPPPNNAPPIPPNPGETVALPPTFTPAPMPTTMLTDPLTSPLLPTATPEMPTPTAPSSPSPTPTIVLTPTITPTLTATPLPSGSMVFRGSIRIRNIRAVGSEPNQGDEYVELQNEGTQQVNLAGWTLRAVRSADGAILSIFVFPGNAVIAAGQTCRIYTNLLFAADNCGFSGGFLSPIPIWPDSGGAHASLFDLEGVEYTRFAY